MQHQVTDRIPSQVVPRKAVWVEFEDPKTGCKYFYNRVTGTTQWERPVEMGP
jgi:hypothetical protein